MLPHTDIDIEIPKKAGVLLLSGTMIFPHSLMDLLIFEPRYRKMLSDVLEGDWMFCIGDLTSEEEPALENCTSEVGTLVLVNASRTLDNGRSSLVVSGLHPVRFDSWDTTLEYPCAEISQIQRIPLSSQDGESVKALIVDILPNSMDALTDSLKEVIISNLSEMKCYSALIDCVAQNFVSDSDLRRELLCEIDDKVRASKLIASLSSS